MSSRIPKGRGPNDDVPTEEARSQRAKQPLQEIDGEGEGESERRREGRVRAHPLGGIVRKRPEIKTGPQTERFRKFADSSAPRSRRTRAEGRALHLDRR